MTQTKTNPLFSWIVVLLFPLYSLPWVIYRVFQFEKVAFVQFAFFMGLVGMLYPPSGDMYRYYQDFLLYKGLDWDTFLLLATINFDYLLALISYFLGIVNIPFDISRFIYNFLGYYLLGKLYLQIRKDNPILAEEHYKNKAFLVFFVISLSNFLFRSGLSNILFLYGLYYILYKNEKKYYIFVFLAVFNHFSFIIFAVLFLISKFYTLKIHKPIQYVLFLFIFFASHFINASILDYLPLPAAYMDHYATYFNGIQAGEITDRFSWKYMLWINFGHYVTYLILLLYISNNRHYNNRENSFINMSFVLCVLSSPFFIMYDRFITSLCFFLKVSYLLTLQKSFRYLKQISILFYLSIMLDLMNIYGNWRQISISDMSILTYKTSFQILGHSYSDSWINNNITERGDIVKYAE